MRAYVQSLAGIHWNAQGSAAKSGFSQLGIECVPFLDEEDLEDMQREDVMVGSRRNTERRLRELGVQPAAVVYPNPLHDFLGRRTFRCMADDLTPDALPLFVRPAVEKSFRPVVAFDLDDLVQCGVEGEVWASEVVWFVSSWRVFVCYGQILGCRAFEGDPDKQPNEEVIARCNDAWKDAPAGFALDFGITEDERTVLIRARDGWCLEPCGLNDKLYARLLSARWAELVGTRDPLA